MIVVNIYPFKSFKERIRLIKDIEGTITIEHNYIVEERYIRGQK